LTPPVLPPPLPLPSTDQEQGGSERFEFIPPEELIEVEPSGGPDILPPEEILAEVESSPLEFCPRCRARLIDPDGLGWCRGCGFCRSLEEDRQKAGIRAAARSAHQPSLLGLVELLQLFTLLPSWIWILLAGMAVTVLFTLPPSLVLPAEGLERALWCTLQMVAGLLMIFAAQWWALWLIAPEDERLTGKDLIIPFRLWSLTLSRLPRLRGPVWLAAWALTAIVSAIFLVGGLEHWLEYLPHRTPPPDSVIESPMHWD
jgi:hypothetical protein